MILFPPSPSLSACDSLADIDDLDAFLEAQGQLSHWPTPPPAKDDIVIDEVEVEADAEDDGLDCKPPRASQLNHFTNDTDRHIARLLTQNASFGADVSELDERMVRRILLRAALPPEVLAVTYRILYALGGHPVASDLFRSAPSDLLVVSALSLAVSYTSDNPPPISHWSQHVCDGTWTAARIDKTSLEVFAALGWRLHEFSHPSALQTALSSLIIPIQVEVPSIRIHEPSTQAESVDISNNWAAQTCHRRESACWAYGQITPDYTLPSCLLG